MRKAILGRKLGMTQVFDDQGRTVPVTVIEAGPCTVVLKRTAEKDGYDAIQVGFGGVKERRVNKPLKGHFEAAKVKPLRYLKEFRLDGAGDYSVGQEIRVDVFSPGELVDVTGVSKGKGFAGGVKRWGFGRGPMAHGSKYHRAPGSLQSRDAARVFKGRKLPGRMGGDRVTVQALKVERVYPDRDLMLIRGAVPGPRGSLVVIRDSVKSRARGE